jgi:hypothetical protein
MKLDVYARRQGHNPILQLMLLKTEDFQRDIFQILLSRLYYGVGPASILRNFLIKNERRLVKDGFLHGEWLITSRIIVARPQ